MATGGIAISERVPAAKHLRHSVRGTLEAIGFSERRSGLRGWSTAGLVLAGFLAGLPLVPRWGVAAALPVFLAYLLAALLAELLATDRYRGPEGLRLRVRAGLGDRTVRLDVTDLAGGASESIEVPASRWCESGRFLRRTRPGLSGDVAALVARVVLAGRGRSLFRILGDEARRTAAGFVTLGAVADAFSRGDHDVRGREPVAPAPFGALLLATGVLAGIQLDWFFDGHGWIHLVAGTVFSGLFAALAGLSGGKRLEVRGPTGRWRIEDEVTKSTYRLTLRRGRRKATATLPLADVIDEGGNVHGRAAVDDAVAELLSKLDAAPAGAAAVTAE